ncbi:MAG: alpha/beta hydrolase [Gammaproteobacteria bacterium]|nr:alpha/beta hydrolase [Gammaproteobacteria bacterium]
MKKQLASVLLMLSLMGSQQARCAEPAADLTGFLDQHEMANIQANGINIAYKIIGEPTAPPLLMIMGLSASHRLWGDAFIERLAHAGYLLVLFDNRDTGETQRMDEFGQPTIWWEMLKNLVGFEVNAAYTLEDMAMDSVALMDALNITDAHIVGASMGGMIAQIIAAEHPERVRSLVSIMSTTGAPHLPSPQDGAGDDLTDIAGSEGERRSELEAIGLHVDAMPRQLMAIIKSGDRTEQVKTISVPTLVIHGEDDTLLPPPHGKHTAAMIEGSRLVMFAGMGHNLPENVQPDLVAAMAEHIDSVESSRLSGQKAPDTTSTAGEEGKPPITN